MIVSVHRFNGNRSPGYELTGTIGGCPRIAIFSKIKACSKNYRRHIVVMPRIIFEYNAEFGEKGILGQPPRHVSVYLQPYPLSQKEEKRSCEHWGSYFVLIP